MKPNAQTPEEQSRAETERQPTVLAGARDSVGRRRPRPIVQLSADRVANDYDHLVDLRVYSPNNRIRGFWDWDREEIERENTFTLVDLEPPEWQRPSRSPSPMPEPGTLEAMLSGSLADPRPPPPGLPIFTDYHFRNNIGIRRHEVPVFTSRFLALPVELQSRVVQLQRQEDIFWMDALERVEDIVWLYNLGPRQREVAHQIQSLYQIAINDIQIEENDGREMIAAAQKLLSGRWPFIGNTEADRFFETLAFEGQECGTLRDGTESRGFVFWMNVVNIVDSNNLSRDLRGYAIRRLLTLRRVERFNDIRVLFGHNAT